MKRIILIFIAALICAASAFTLAACEFGNVEGEGTLDVKAEGKTDSLELAMGFFDELKKDADVVVTYKSNGVVQFTESIKGTTSNVLAKDGTKIYAFIKDGVYCYAYENEYTHYSEEDKSLYDQYFCYFLSDLKMMELMPEDGVTFKCTLHTEEKDSVINGEQTTESDSVMSLEIVSEGGSIKITANAHNGIVESVSVQSSNTDNPQYDRNITMEFEYGTAEVSLPDIDAWSIADHNAESIFVRDEFFFSTLYAGNVIITVEDGESVFVETIADGVDYVLYPAGNKTYSFITDDDEYIYALEDDLSKYYFTGEEWYEIGCTVYYSLFISIYDDITNDPLVSAAFVIDCDVDEDEYGNGTMVFTIGAEGETLFTLTATKAGGIVLEATLSTRETFKTMSFEYDVAEISAPDISEWQSDNSEEE